MNWRPITQDDPPKAPCVLADDRKGEPWTHELCLTQEKWEQFKPSSWTLWLPLPTLPPAKHPVEVAFEAWWKQTTWASDGKHAAKDAVRWALRYAAETMCEPQKEFFTNSIMCNEMRDRLTRAAESL